MERRRRRACTTEKERVELAKAAAWAWYQRSVGEEGMPARAIQSPRPPRQLRPSRFKLEAAAAARRETRGEARSSRGVAVAGTRGAPRSAAPPPKKTPPPAKINKFWMRHAIGVCGPVADVLPQPKVVPVTAGNHRRR